MIVVNSDMVCVGGEGSGDSQIVGCSELFNVYRLLSLRIYGEDDQAIKTL